MRANFARLGPALIVKEADEMMLSLGVQVTVRPLSSHAYDRSMERVIHHCKGEDDG
ncbi:MAG TPA: hypothetical protein VGH56_04250 [Solirubrobacteraceae bacterium]|jgi:hypothetical protein